MDHRLRGESRGRHRTRRLRDDRQCFLHGWRWRRRGRGSASSTAGTEPGTERYERDQQAAANRHPTHENPPKRPGNVTCECAGISTCRRPKTDKSHISFDRATVQTRRRTMASHAARAWPLAQVTRAPRPARHRPWRQRRNHRPSPPRISPARCGDSSRRESARRRAPSLFSRTRRPRPACGQ